MNFAPQGAPPGFAPNTNPPQGAPPGYGQPAPGYGAPQAPPPGYGPPQTYGTPPAAPAPAPGYGPPPGYGAPPPAAPPGYGAPPAQPGYGPTPAAPAGYGPPQPPQGYQPPPGYQGAPQNGNLPNFAGADSTELSTRTASIPEGHHHFLCKGRFVADTLMGVTFEAKQSSTLKPGDVVAFKQNRNVAAQHGGDKTRDASLLSCLLPLAGWAIEDTPESKAKIQQLGAQGYKSRLLSDVFGAGTIEGRPLETFEVYCIATPKERKPNADPTKPVYCNLKFIPVNPR